MPAQKRHKTKYPGVYYIEGKAIGTDKPEKIFYIMYRKDGKQVHEKAGRQYQDDMTPARAAQIRSLRIKGKELSNKEQREAVKAEKDREANKWTIDKLFDAYIQSRPENKARGVDVSRYNKYLKCAFGKKEPKELLPLDVDRVRIKLLKKLSPQTVLHILNLLSWIINYGVKKNLCDGIAFQIQKPTVNNVTTEDLSNEQLKALIAAIEADSNIQIKNLMKTALYTGMRRGELFNLKWDDVDFDRGFIHIKDPKGGIDQKIPMNDTARRVLKTHPRTGSDYVFPGRNGEKRVSAQSSVNKIKKRAALPKSFRPLHGLRHAYASMLASSGKVDMYTLQKLLTHKDQRMTQRYAHLRDEALKHAADVTDTLFATATSTDGEKVVNFEKGK